MILKWIEQPQYNQRHKQKKNALLIINLQQIHRESLISHNHFSSGNSKFN